MRVRGFVVGAGSWSGRDRDRARGRDAYASTAVTTTFAGFRGGDMQTGPNGDIWVVPNNTGNEIARLTAAGAETTISLSGEGIAFNAAGTKAYSFDRRGSGVTLTTIDVAGNSEDSTLEITDTLGSRQHWTVITP